MVSSEPSDLPRLFTVGEVCAALHVHRSTLERFMATGQLRAVRIGRQVRIPADALEEFMNSLKPRNSRLTDEAAS